MGDSAIQKARRGAGLVALLVRRCSNPLTVLKPLWQSYILPAVLYGTEIMDVNKTYIKDIETIQRGLMKSVLRVIPGTATTGCYAVTGLSDITQEIWKKIGILLAFSLIQSAPRSALSSLCHLSALHSV